MEDYRLGAVEARFADIIWRNAPLRSRELVELCQAELNWKKPTTYTVLRKLCERGIFQNENGTVTPVLTREDFYSRQSREFVDTSFRGSLPAFLAAFTAKEKLTRQEIAEIRSMIDAFEENCHD